MTQSHSARLVPALFLASFFVLAPFAGVSRGQATDTTTGPGSGTVRTTVDDDDDDDDDEGFPWGLLGLLGLLGLAGLKPRREPVVHTRTHDTARP
jgi:MYXO-CTERM domain-containing protein